jgi:lipoprotein-anchoring transpeptidase ErfK/SrfK
MKRTKAAKMMRTAMLAVGLAVTLIVALGAVMSAVAAVPGDPLRLGQLNSINAFTKLVGTRPSALFQVKNNGGPAISLNVPAGQPPAVVSAGAGNVSNLNVDLLDGHNAAVFMSTKTYLRTASGPGTPNAFDHVSAFCDPGDRVIGGGYLKIDAPDTFIAGSIPFISQPQNGWQVI